MKKLVDIIIPTFNNLQQINQLLVSFKTSTCPRIYRIIIVNNGTDEHVDYFDIEGLDTFVLNPKENLGWEGGLKEGLGVSESQYVMFMNDDTLLLPYSDILTPMAQWLHSNQIGAVGPSSNVVMGQQNIFLPCQYRSLNTKILVGFCVMMKRSVLDEIGGVDDSLHGGDDFDLSIRIRRAGYLLVILRDVFVFHHGFQTGIKVHGNYWNSDEMTEKVKMDIIRKHGFREWYETMSSLYNFIPLHPIEPWQSKYGEALQDQNEFFKLYDLVKNHNPKTIVEIGVYKGATYSYWKELCDNVIGIDIANLIGDESLIIGNSRHIGTFTKVAERVNGGIDFLYIDGAHEYTSVKKDFELYEPLVKEGGLIALHDINNKTQLGVSKFWDEIKDNYKHEIISSGGDDFGIGIIYK